MTKYIVVNTKGIATAIEANSEGDAAYSIGEFGLHVFPDNGEDFVILRLSLETEYRVGDTVAKVKR